LVEDAGEVVRQARAGTSVREHVGPEHASAGCRAEARRAMPFYTTYTTPHNDVLNQTTLTL
jgi:hypothetical protein